MAIRHFGRYVVADPDVCDGVPTFRGTRIMVSDVLDQVATGLAWQAIIEEWCDSISKEAIAEAVHLAKEALIAHPPELVGESLG